MSLRSPKAKRRIHQVVGSSEDRAIDIDACVSKSRMITETGINGTTRRYTRVKTSHEMPNTWTIEKPQLAGRSNGIVDCGRWVAGYDGCQQAAGLQEIVGSVGGDS